MVGQSPVTIKVNITSRDAALFSRLILGYMPQPNTREDQLICISPNHPKEQVQFTTEPVAINGDKTFYNPADITCVDWKSLIMKETVTLTTEDGRIWLEYIGTNRTPLTSYYSHVVRVAPALDPAFAVNSRLIKGINKGVKRAGSRKRQKQAVFYTVAKARNSHDAFLRIAYPGTHGINPLVSAFIKEELSHLPEEIVYKGLTAIAANLSNGKAA